MAITVKSSENWTNSEVSSPMAREFLDKSLDVFIQEFVKDQAPSTDFKENLLKSVDKLSKRQQLKDILHLLTKENLLRSQVRDNAPNDPVSGNAPNDPVSDNAPDDPVSGNAPNDPVGGNAPNDPVSGNAPNDPVGDNAPDDQVSGNAPNDPVGGNAPSDPVSGIAPNDPICGNAPDSAVNGSLDPLDIEEFLKYLETKRRQFSAGKIFNDPIHGHMEIHPACVLIIDTPQFQRLRYIKQLGMCYFVYPGASHNRFEHSIGTCYLAGQFCRSLRENQPELGITDMDILCVEIAGLCHDLGQGPFSRLFVDRFRPSLMGSHSNAQDQTEKEYARKHKVPSAQMFDYLLSKNQEVKDKLKNDYGISEAELCFIKEQIDGPPVTGSTAWPYEGRPEYKAYLYEIVSNLRNGIDVCKWDYLARDCHHLGISNSFDHRRYMQFARVIEESGEHQICLRKKEVGNVYQMFYSRYNLNKYAYKHHANCAIEEMVVDVLIKANDFFEFGETKDDTMSMSEYFKRQHSQQDRQDEDSRVERKNNNMSALSEMTDDVLYKIRYDTRKELEPPKADLLKDSKEILERIYNRKLYTRAYETDPMKLQPGTTVATITDDIIKEYPDIEGKFFVQIVHLDFGMKEENPVRRLRVYRKDNVHKARPLTKDEVSQIICPENHNEQIVRLYSKSTVEEISDNLKDIGKRKWPKEDEKEK